MKTIVFFSNRDNIPSMEKLATFIWSINVSYSYIKTGNDFYDSDDLAISWDKWIDNHEWSGHDKSSEYIGFNIVICKDCIKKFKLNLISKEIDSKYCMRIDIADDALLIDKRAYLRAIYLIAKSCNGYILEENSKSLLTSDEFYEKYRDIIEMPFTKEFKIVY